MMENNYEMKDHKSEKKSKSGLVSALIIILLILLVVTAVFYFRSKTSDNGSGEGFFAELFGQKVNIDGSTSSSNAGKGGKTDKTEDPALTAMSENSSKTADDVADKAKTDTSNVNSANADPADDQSDAADNNQGNTDDSSDQTSNGEHQHVFDKWVTVKEATCGDAGEEQATCSCGATTTRTIPPTGDHAWGDWEVVEGYQDLAPAFGGAENPGDVGGPAPGDQVIDQQGRIRRRTCRECNQVQEEVNN